MKKAQTTQPLSLPSPAPVENRCDLICQENITHRAQGIKSSQTYSLACNSHALFSSICCLFKISTSCDLAFPIQCYRLRRAIKNKLLEFQIEMMVLLRNALFLIMPQFLDNVMIPSSDCSAFCQVMGAENSMMYSSVVSQTRILEKICCGLYSK